MGLRSVYTTIYSVRLRGIEIDWFIDRVDADNFAANTPGAVVVTCLTYVLIEEDRAD